MLLLFILLSIYSISTTDATNLRNSPISNSQNDYNENGKEEAVSQPEPSQIQLTLCQNRCKGNCIVFETPTSKCFNGKTLFPDDDTNVWGEFDVFDLVQIPTLEEEDEIEDNAIETNINGENGRKRRKEPTFVRYFFETRDSSCDGNSLDLVDVTKATDKYVLPLDACVGPFGPPRPWGTFQLLKDDGNLLDANVYIADN